MDTHYRENDNWGGFDNGSGAVASGSSNPYNAAMHCLQLVGPMLLRLLAKRTGSTGTV